MLKSPKLTQCYSFASVQHSSAQHSLTPVKFHCVILITAQDLAAEVGVTSCVVILMWTSVTRHGHC